MSDSDKKSIVVIDDSMANIQFLMLTLRNFYNITPFTSANVAIDFFSKGNVCDLILLDVEMPQLSGFEAIRLLKELDNVKDIPVVFLSGNLDSQTQIEAYSEGCIDYICKPFVPQIVQKKVNLYISMNTLKKDYERLLSECGK